ncbi:MAG: hypothetical protein GC161_09240 [Planctomycetaceae bacterium]|nr:hypothetical protein [Planctomycetaceae bacterium]
MMFDPVWIVITLVGMALSGLAAMRVRSTFQRWSEVPLRSGMSGVQAAHAVCRAAGVTDVTIERVDGFLSDHYDPTTRTLRLSPDVYDGRSVSSVAVAAHEAGHAIQHADAYAWLGFRSKMVPVAVVGSRLWWIVFMIGALLNATAPAMGSTLMLAAIGMFGALVLLQVVTLPVEFDASRRAKLVLASSGIVTSQEEARGVESVLGAAAMTYVAAAASSIAQLVYLILQYMNSNR